MVARRRFAEAIPRLRVGGERGFAGGLCGGHVAAALQGQRQYILRAGQFADVALRGEGFDHGLQGRHGLPRLACLNLHVGRLALRACGQFGLAERLRLRGDLLETRLRAGIISGLAQPGGA